MTPIRFRKWGEVARLYESPFVGPVNHTVGILVQLSGLSSAEIDARGYLKPGIPLTRDGTLVGNGEDVFGVTVEEVKVAEDNNADTISYLEEVEVAVALIGTLNQEVAESLLGRSYTVDEIAGFEASQIVLLTPTS